MLTAVEMTSAVEEVGPKNNTYSLERERKRYAAVCGDGNKVGGKQSAASQIRTIYFPQNEVHLTEAQTRVPRLPKIQAMALYHIHSILVIAFINRE